DKLDVIADGFIERHDGAGVDLQHLSRGQVELHLVAAGMDENGSGTGELFQYESLAAEESGAQFLHQRNLKLDARLGKEKSVALAKDGAAGGKLEHLNAAWIVACETDFTR